MGCWWQPGRVGSLSTSTVQGRPERVRLRSERLMPPALSLGHRVSCSSAADTPPPRPGTTASHLSFFPGLRVGAAMGEGAFAAPWVRLEDLPRQPQDCYARRRQMLEAGVGGEHPPESSHPGIWAPSQSF